MKNSELNSSTKNIGEKVNRKESKPTFDLLTDRYDSEARHKSISLNIASQDGTRTTKILTVPGQYVIGSGPFVDIAIEEVQETGSRIACLIVEPEFVLLINYEEVAKGAIGRQIRNGEKVCIGGVELEWNAELPQMQQAPISSKSPSGGIALRVDGYESIKELGSGSFGSVYLAKQLGTNRHVAIKTLLPSFSEDEKLRRIFLREASILANLHHPNIVRSLGTGFQNELLYIVMEYVPCEDLRSLVENTSTKKRFKFAVGIITKVLRALEHAHEQGIVHRDVKLANILGYKHEGRLHVKLSDFGLAKCFETAGHSGISETSTICGTLAYMSPQQIADSKYAKPASDIYSATITLYLLLTGRFPHTQTNYSELIRAKLNTDAPSPRTCNPEIPEALSNVIERNLKRDISQRDQTATELIGAINEAL